MKPLVSYLLFGYKHERFIEQALESAVAQDYEPMEIIVSDDASTDATADVIERFIARYDGPKRIRFRRNPVNLGLATTFNNAAGEAEGAVIVGAAGDDVSCPDRVTRLMRLFADETVLCAFSNASVIDEHGSVQRPHYRNQPPRMDLWDYSNPYAGVLGATAAYRRSVFTDFGPLAADLIYEDRVLSVRAAIAGRIVYTDEKLVLYRRHDSNVWNGIMLQFEQRSDWLRHEVKVTRDTIVVVKSRIRDIDTGITLVPHRARELRRLRQHLSVSLHRLEVQLTMFGSSAAQRVPVAIGHVLSGRAGGPRRVWGFLKKNFLPERHFRDFKASRVAREERLQEPQPGGIG